MCTNCNLNTPYGIYTNPSSPGSGPDMNLIFPVEGSPLSTNYGKINFVTPSVANPVNCCYEIENNFVGIILEGTNLKLKASLSGLAHKEEVQTPTHDPKFALKKIGTEIFFIGIDDIRGYDNPRYQFRLSSGGGVNVKFNSNTKKLIVQGNFKT